MARKIPLSWDEPAIKQFSKSRDTSGRVGVAKVPIARFPIEIHAWLAGQVTEAFLGSAPTYLAHATAGARSWRLPTLYKIIIPDPPT